MNIVKADLGSAPSLSISVTPVPVQAAPSLPVRCSSPAPLVPGAVSAVAHFILHLVAPVPFQERLICSQLFLAGDPLRFPVSPRRKSILPLMLGQVLRSKVQRSSPLSPEACPHPQLPVISQYCPTPHPWLLLSPSNCPVLASLAPTTPHPRGLAPMPGTGPVLSDYWLNE